MDFARPLAVVGPTLDGDVLAVLAGAATAFTGRDVHRMVRRGSQQGVRKALERLVAQGIVLTERAGAARLYQLNRQHLAAPYVERLAQLRQELIERLRQEVRDWRVPPAYAALFGSVAEGRARRGSDVDLFVVRPAGRHPDDPQWVDQISLLEERVSAWTGNDARVLEYGEEELIGAVSGGSVLTDVRRQGVRLIGSSETIPVGPSGQDTS